MSIDPTRCKASVWSNGIFRSHQCERRAVKDGYCKQHHPDSVKARSEASEAKFKERMAKSPYAQLAKLKDQNKEMYEALKYATRELEASGLCFDHPTIVKLDALLARIEGEK